MNGSEFEQYVRQYKDSVYLTALYYLKNRSDAEDVTQDVFFKLYTHTAEFNDEAHIKAWLLRCAVNESKNILMSYRYRFSRPLDEAAEIAGDTGLYDEDEMLILMRKLSRNDRLALYLYYYEGYSVGETAAILGISENAVSSRLKRGRQKLKKLIESGKEAGLI